MHPFNRFDVTARRVALVLLVCWSCHAAQAAVAPVLRALDAAIAAAESALVATERVARHLAPTEPIRTTHGLIEVATDRNSASAWIQLDLPLADRLIARRFELSLHRDADRWVRDEAQLVAEDHGIRRLAPERLEWRRFAAFSLELGGLTVRVDDGTVAMIPWGDQPSTLLVSGRSLSWDLAFDHDASDGPLAKAWRAALTDRALAAAVAQKSVALRITADPTTGEQLLQRSFGELRGAQRDAAPVPLRAIVDAEVEAIRRARVKDPFAGFGLSAIASFGYPLDLQAVTAPARWLVVDTSAPKSDAALTFTFGIDGPACASIRLRQGRMATAQSTTTLRFPLDAASRSSLDFDRPEVANCDVERASYRALRLDGEVRVDFDSSFPVTGDIESEVELLHPSLYLPAGVLRRERRSSSSSAARDEALVQFDRVRWGADRPGLFIAIGDAGIIPLPAEATPGQRLKVSAKFQARSLSREFPVVHAGADWIPLARGLEWSSGVNVTLVAPARNQVLGTWIPQPQTTPARDAPRRWIADREIASLAAVVGDFHELQPAPRSSSPARHKVYLWRTSSLDSSSEPTPFPPAQIRRQVAAAIDYFGTLTGAPFLSDSYSLLFGATNAANIGKRASVLPAVGALPAYFHEQQEVRDVEWIDLAAEVACQWWGGHLRAVGRDAAWLNAAMPRFLAALFIEQTEGETAYRRQVERWRTAAQASSRQTTFPADSLNDDGLNPLTAYKDLVALARLREVAGSDRFRALLQSLYSRAPGSTITMADFSAAVKAAVGRDKVGGNSDDWLNRLDTEMTRSSPR